VQLALGGHPRNGASDDRPDGQHAAPARHLPGLFRPDCPQSARRARANDGPVGHAVADFCAQGAELRFRRHQCVQHQIPSLATLARGRESLRGPMDELIRERGAAGRLASAVWFAFDETHPLPLFAGIWTRWTSVRKVKEGETTNDLFAFLTSEPNKEVGMIHPQAMPVILTTQEGIDLWDDGTGGGSVDAATAPAGQCAQDRRERTEEG
jgi:hypothetical protein